MVLYSLWCYVVYTVVQTWSFCSCPGTHSLEQGGRGGQSEGTVGGWELALFLQLMQLQVNVGAIPCGDHIAQHLVSDSCNRRTCLGRTRVGLLFMFPPLHPPNARNCWVTATESIDPFRTYYWFLGSVKQTSDIILQSCLEQLVLSSLTEARATHLHSELASYSC